MISIHPIFKQSRAGQIKDLHEIEHKARCLEGVEEHHVTDAAVGDGWRVHRDVVLVAPIVHTFRIVDHLTHPADHLGWCPHHSLLPLLHHHLVQDGRQPFLEHHLLARHNETSAAATLQWLT
jgi:hypothetical protein